MTKLRAIYLTSTFLTLIFAISIINLLKGTTNLSVYENRNLEARPGFQAIKNGDFASKYEKYYADQFILRDDINEFSTKIDLLRGKSFVRDMYIAKDNWLLPQMDLIENNVPYLAELATKQKEFANALNAQGKSFHMVITPYRGIVMRHLYPDYATGMDILPDKLKIYKTQLDANNTSYTSLDDYFLNNFDKKALESLYFKTDHHWNIFGAYEGFKYIMKNLGDVNHEYKNITIDDNNYVKIYVTDKVFRGSHSTNLYNLLDYNEPVPMMYNKNNPNYEVYIYENGNFTKKKPEELLYSSRNSKTITYEGAYTLGLACYKIVNKSAQTDKKILIFRDSYQSPTVQFFADVFKEVIVIDPRYVDDVKINAKEMAFSLDVDIVMPMFMTQTLEELTSDMLR